VAASDLPLQRFMQTPSLASLGITVVNFLKRTGFGLGKGCLPPETLTQVKWLDFADICMELSLS
jgi:hypothetical protein